MFSVAMDDTIMELKLTAKQLELKNNISKQ